ncbi:MAG: hypothetical protein GX144_07010 [Clostridiaceae bacterium]|nr:hypothetical protein [Clostridiaceae bacterium]
MDWTRRGKPNNAAKPNFTSKDAISIINSLAAKLGYISESGGWDNIPDSLTDSSLIGKNQYTNKYGYPDGSLAGSGTSNHGLGSALDLNFGLAEEAKIGCGIRHWVEDFGKGYGFWGYCKKNATEYIEEDGIGNFEESWHLNYYGPNGPKSR